MKKADFLAVVQSRVARVAVGASTVRGRGHTGTVEAARRYFRGIDLGKYGVPPAKFKGVLDRETLRLVRALPRAARRWGIARKLLNIFLRDCLYSRHLSDAYTLERAESAMEVPLDSITAHHLKMIAGRGGLPPWPGVKHATRELSALYQAVAAEEATRLGVSRVHLDAVWWSASRDGN